MAVVAVAAVLATTLAGCGSSGETRSAPTPARPATQASSPTPSPERPPSPTLSPPDLQPPMLWRVGASPLPLRPDGFGQVLPTPPVLRNRTLPTKDLLPPPRDGRFAATTGAVTGALRHRMGESWSPACPVRLSQLRYLTVSFRGFDGKAHTGELVVAARVAPDVVAIFRRLYELRFPIEEMRLPTTADLRAPPTGDGNNTAAYVCRAARGQKRFSAHAYGLAIDVNPFDNPLVKRDLVVPELASAYVDRSWQRPGMFYAGRPPVLAFTSRGWVWGGTWTSSKDRMHFSVTGM